MAYEYFEMVHKNLKDTFVLPVETVAWLDEEAPEAKAFEAYINARFTAQGLKGPGTVHTWEYADGSVRATFQPEIREQPKCIRPKQLHNAAWATEYD